MSEYLKVQTRNVYREARKKMKKAIIKSKSNAFMALRDKIDENHWGNAYKVVLTRLRGKNANTPNMPHSTHYRAIINTTY